MAMSPEEFSKSEHCPPHLTSPTKMKQEKRRTKEVGRGENREGQNGKKERNPKHYVTIQVSDEQNQNTEARIEYSELEP